MSHEERSSDLNTTETCTPPAPTNGAADAPQIIDVRLDTPIARQWSWGLALVTAIPAGIAVGVVTTLLGRVNFWIWVAEFVLMMPATLLFMRGVKARQQRWARQAMEKASGSQPEGAAKAIVSNAGTFLVETFVQTVLEEMIARGQDGVVMRIGPEASATPVAPMTLPFEPCELNEAEAAFMGLDEAALEPSVARDDAPDETLKWSRNFRRYRKLVPFLWFMIVVFSIGLFSALVRAIMSFRFNWEIPFFAGMLVLFLFPTMLGSLAPFQWLVVPGGLVHRSTKSLTRKWSVHVFDRRSSVLCVYHYKKARWGFCAADAVMAKQGFCTDTELEFLLRAWLSPLPPPTAQQLSDLQ